MNNQINSSLFQRIANLVIKYPLLNLWVPVIIVSGIIFYFSHQSQIPQPPFPIPYLDKIEHIVIYTALGYFVKRALSKSETDYLSRYSSINAIIFCILYGISDEFHQSFIPTREASGFDIIADGAGGILGSWIYAKNILNRLLNIFHG